MGLFIILAMRKKRFSTLRETKTYRVSEYKRTLASFPLLISSSAGSLSYLTVVNREEPTPTSPPISVFSAVSVSFVTSLLLQTLHTQCVVTHCHSEHSRLLFFPQHVWKRHQLGPPKQVHLRLVLHQHQPHAHLESDHHGVALAAPCGHLMGASSRHNHYLSSSLQC